TPLQETLDTHNTQTTITPTLRRNESHLTRLTTSLTQNTTPTWTTLLTPQPPTPLPTYPFQHQHYWPETRAARDVAPPDAQYAEHADDAPFWDAVHGGHLGTLADELELSAEGQEAWSSVLPALSSWRRRREQRSLLDRWRYRIEWRPTASASSPSLSGTWIVAVPEGRAGDGRAAESLRALDEAGAHVVPLTVATDGVDRSALVSALRAAAEDTGEIAGVLSLLALDEENATGFPSVPAGHAATLALVQALGDGGIGAPVWVCTSGAVSVGEDDAVRNPVQALVWGLGRIVALEHSERWGGLIDLPETLDAAARGHLAAALAGLDGEDQVALRSAGLLARRLVRAPIDRDAAPRAWQPSGTVLVTGGTGALGGHTARWLARNGAERLVLVSRRGPDAPGAEALVAELTALGAEVTVAACDIADRDALAGLIASIPDSAPLTAVMHTAAALDDGLVESLTAGQVDHALRVKVDGTRNLHELTRHLDLTAFVLFSSVSATFGGPGQGNYAPGNAFLDAFAQYRRALGLPATSVAWGPWSGGGMAEGGVGALARRHGLPQMDPAQAAAGLRDVLDHDETFVAVVDVEWERFFVAFTATRRSRLLEELPDVHRILASGAGGAVPRPERSQDDDRTEFTRAVADAAPAEREELVLEAVRAQVAAVLGHASPDVVNAERAFQELGFDSVTAVELRNRLNTATGLALPATLVFDHPTARALARHLTTAITGDTTDATPVSRRPAVVGSEDDPIAIIGMSCRFPGDTNSPEDLWKLLAAGRDAMSDFPEDRGWDLDRLYDPEAQRPGTSYTNKGGFLYGAAEFDAAFFGISPREAVTMDPQQRLLLEVSWETLERAGVDPTSLRGSATGVYIGSNSQDYGTLVAGAADSEGHLSTGTTPSVMSGRISYVLGLEGPALTVDTACSSSLVALHLAAQALRRGECTLALAGGATVMATPDLFREFSRQRGLAADGRCKSFAGAADGTGFSEGAGVLLLERLSDAERLGHRVLAVIRGSAVNQDGASNGLTAPNGPSQERVIRDALAAAGLGTGDVDAVEAHGTGTRLGDPIEAQTLLKTYGHERGEHPLYLGSLKSNIGHTQAAAGVGGVIKMVMAMRHGLLPQTLHVDEPSPHIDWTAGDVELLTEQRPWPSNDRPRRAGVSAFGISGTNAHVILEQAPQREEQPEPSAALPVVPCVLSARDETALRAQAQRLLDHLDTHPELEPAQLAWSLASTRTAFDHRAAVLATDRNHLTNGLTALTQGQP
ncbi:SDR family NAD(P)-dependent oxidoreductase, partial [Streptomyces sp. NPDC050803]